VADDELSELLARALDEGVAPEPPADRVDELRRRAEDRRAEGAVPIPGPRHRRGRTSVAVAAAVIAVLAGFGVARLLAGPDEAGVAGDVEFDGTMTGSDGQTADAELTVVGTGIGRVVELRTGALPILPIGEYYEVWFVSGDDVAGAPDRISAGTFHPDPNGRSDVRFTAAVDPTKYPHVEITAEPGDGNPLPTGPVVLRASIGV
jgi:hypothetical protein